MNPDGIVESEVNNGIGSVTFGHPQSNSMPGKLLRALAAEITKLGQNQECNVIVLRSAGEGAFCAGASFTELLSVKTLNQGVEFFSGFAAVLLAIKNAPKFVIARVHGKAAGGGMGLVTASDYALATSGAAIRLSELALGIGPFTIGPAVQRKIGLASFNELAITADWRDAEWAKQHGVYCDIFENVSQLDEAVSALAVKLAKYSPVAMAELKRVLWEGTDDWESLLTQRATISAELVLTEASQAAIARAKSGAK